MKNALSKLGNVGIAVYWVISIALFIMPLAIIGLPWWVNVIIYFVILSIPVVGDIAELVVFVWAFTVAINQPFDWVSLLFYISFVLFIVTTVVPNVMGFISDCSRKP